MPLFFEIVVQRIAAHPFAETEVLFGLKTVAAWRFDMTESRESRKMECFVFVLFVISISVISYFHEPWLDEAQAWMIAREASLWEILFQVPHTEGHPPLWHLILLPFAKGGVPYEIGIKSIAVLISTGAAGLVLFCSPFAKGVRCLLPFTYFFFYQYGVIARPYGLMLVTLLLVACVYSQRNVKPWKFVLLLGALCLTSAYGIVFAGGICVVWLLEIWKKQSIFKFVKKFLHDRRFAALLVLLLFAVCLILEIWPGKDTYTGARYYENGMLFKTVFVFFVLPVESLFGQCITSYASIGNIRYSTGAFVIEIILGILLWGLLIWYGRKKKTLLLLLIPVCLFDVFAVTVYLYIHHIGVIFLYLIFWYWICVDKAIVGEQKGKEWGFWGVNLPERDFLLLQRIGKALPYIFVLVSVWWNLSASVAEVRENYGYASGVVEFLTEHDMMGLNILAEWKSGRNADGKTYYEDSDCRYVTVAMLPYLTDQQINHLLQYGEKPYYNSNIPADEERNQYNYQLWASRGVPDVVIGTCELEEVYDGKVTMRDYTPVAEIPTNFIWKNLVTRQYLFIYLKTDLLEQYHVTSLLEQEGNHYINNRVPLQTEGEE